MMMAKKFVFIFIAVFVLAIFCSMGIPSVIAANEGSMVLLAMSERDGVIKGGVADLHLEIKPGTGRVYMDTFPLTKLDTQISIRFAKEIACDYIGTLDCSRYDFFYTIRSDSIIIGGPSAGAALTMLTIATLHDWDFDQKHAVTGTINPGGFIGTVGGVEAKIEAAAKSGLNKVMIPKGSLSIEESVMNFTEGMENKSFEDTKDVRQMAQNYGLEIVEVSTLDEVVHQFTGKTIEHEKIDIVASERYEKVMKNISEGLCTRTSELFDLVDDNETGLYKTAVNLSLQSEKALLQEAFYSASSFCFGANINLNYLHLQQLNMTDEVFNETVAETEDWIDKIENQMEEMDRNTINNLQTYMIVKERLLESRAYLDTMRESLKVNNTDSAVYNLAYAQERARSAEFWGYFESSEGREFIMDEEALRRSCIRKLSEAEERYQYANLYMGGALQATRDELNEAYRMREQEQFSLCLFKASKAKAEADLLLGSIGVREETMDDYIDIKFQIIEKAIKKHQEAGIFPILGYSYYEYAKSLRETDPRSAMLYSEYAIELTKLELYFETTSGRPMEIAFDWDRRITLYFLLGSIFGILITLLFSPRIRKEDKDEHLRIKIRRNS